ncbi:MAG: S9 family peptidase [Xanthomonadaceae bacterium]|nr:S9 family peptidase [Xanthomonadaceae bacterium]
MALRPSRLPTLAVVLVTATTCGRLLAAPAPPAGAAGAGIDAVLQRLQQAQPLEGVAIAPDGRQLAWVAKTAHGTRITIATRDGAQPRTIAVPGLTTGRCNDGDAAWSPDGRTLAFLSDCGAPGARQSNIDLLDTADAHAQPRRLTDLQGHVRALAWAPDGTRIGFLYVPGAARRVDALAATGPQVGVIGVADVAHQRVAAVDVRSGRVRLLTPAALFPYEFSWSPHARRISYVAAPPPGDDNWWVARLYVQEALPDAKPVVVVDPGTVTGPLHGLQVALPRFAPDGRSIAFIGGLMSDQGVTGGDLYLAPASGGAPVNLTPGIGITPSWLTWTGTDRLLVSSFAGGSTRLSGFVISRDAQGRPQAREHALATLPATITAGTAMSSLAVTANHQAIAFVRSTFSAPPEIWTAALATDAAGTPTRIDALHAVTRINAGIRPLWGRAESVHWINQGFHVQGWLLYPAGYDPHKSYPLIVSVHGGPSYAVQPRWPGVGYGGAPLSALGYFVLFPNPRGSFGQGEAFTRANRRDFGYGDLRDILAGVDAVEKRVPVDDHRLGLTGWSYGGFMTMFAPTQTRRFRAAVAGAGLSDWLSYTGENSIDQWMTPFFGASVYDDPAVYAKSSAINFIKNDKTPTLLVVGQYDAECPAPQSFEFWHGLKAMGVPTELVVYPDEGHGFVDPAHRRDVLVRALGWFARYLPARGDAPAGR